MILQNARRSIGQNDKARVTKVIDLLNSGLSLWQIDRRLTEIPEIRAAVNFIAEKISIVPLYHIRARPVQNKTNMLEIEYMNSKYDSVLSIRPNPYQTPQAFKSCIMARRLYYNNAFVLPEWDYSTGNLKWLYPLPFKQFRFEEINGMVWIIFDEAGTSFLYDDIIHLQRFPTEKGGMKTQAIGNYNEIVTAMQMQAVKQIEASGKLKALLISKSGLKDSDMKTKLNEFTKNYLTAENLTGFGMVTGNYEVQELKNSIQALDTELMNKVIEYIYNYLGISKKIINFEASELEWQQFVNSLETPLQELAEEFTFKLFSNDEISKYNRIIYDTLCLEIGTLAAKTQFLDKSIYNGLISSNEGRQRLGYGWREGGDELISNKNAASLKNVT